MKHVIKIIFVLKKKKITFRTNFENLDSTDWEFIMPRH